MIKIVVTDVATKEKTKFPGMAQATHFAMESAGKVKITVSDGTTKTVTFFKDGKSVKQRVVALTPAA